MPKESAKSDAGAGRPTAQLLKLCRRLDRRRALSDVERLALEWSARRPPDHLARGVEA
jgi:hypothetical protein